MDQPDDYDEIYTKLKRNRERILLLLFRHGDLRSREIREQTGLSRGSKNHHFGVLEDWGLIEVVNHDEESGGYPERVFGLTDEGREFVGEYLTDGGERPDGYELRVERLEDDVDDLQVEVERLEDAIEDRDATIAELDERLTGVIKRLHEHWDELATEQNND